MKVTYFLHDDNTHVTTAYLEDTPLKDGSYVGTNKHTDLPVHVRWNDKKSRWAEVCSRKWDMVDVLNEKYEEDPEARSDPNCDCLKEENAPR